MNDLRIKRLLLLATTTKDHKRWYSQYCELNRMGYTSWMLGHAFITDAGNQKLKEMKGN